MGLPARFHSADFQLRARLPIAVGLTSLFAATTAGLVLCPPQSDAVLRWVHPLLFAYLGQASLYDPPGRWVYAAFFGACTMGAIYASARLIMGEDATTRRRLDNYIDAQLPRHEEMATAAPDGDGSEEGSQDQRRVVP